ncbi:MAG: GNAT family N-acetyltransferase [Dehalococcoidia bacterium]
MSSNKEGARRIPLDLLALEVATSYTMDAAGDLESINEFPLRPAPRVFLGRTREGDRVWFRGDVASTVRTRVRELVATLPAWAGGATGGAVEALQSLLGDANRAYAGPSFVFSRPLFPAGAMQIYPSQGALLHPELVSWALELRERKPCFAVFQAGQAVAICCSSRNGQQAAAAGVETVAAFRGRGFAALATEAWAAEVRKGGRIPFYGTTWENLASQSVAAKLGLELFAESIHVT